MKHSKLFHIQNFSSLRDSSYKAAVFIYSLLDNRHEHIFGYKKGNDIKNVFQTDHEKLF